MAGSSLDDIVLIAWLCPAVVFCLGAAVVFVYYAIYDYRKGFRDMAFVSCIVAAAFLAVAGLFYAWLRRLLS